MSRQRVRALGQFRKILIKVQVSEHRDNGCEACRIARQPSVPKSFITPIHLFAAPEAPFAQATKV
jgi:hypothetical protein